MSVFTGYNDKVILILDDMPEMRSSLRSQLGTLGCEDVAVCGTVKEALEHVRQRHFDVIVCDYYLAGGTDGQQFLEYLRTRDLISRRTVFIMVTAEKSYESVVTVAECLPDEYLLKPFTADALRIRVERLFEKKKRLAKVDLAQDRKNWPAVIAACDEIIAAKDRYMIDALRIKGHALLESGQAEAAIAFYQQMLAMRPLPWAKLGLAKALERVGNAERSKETLSDLIVEAPKLMAAYDLLGRLHSEAGEHDEAIRVLDQACTISPDSLARHRAIAGVAEKKGDFSRVEKALSNVVKRTRNSPLRETGDIARLGAALTEIGEPAKAVALLEEARTNFKEDAANPLLAAVEAIAQQQAGNADKAAAALSRATQSGVAGLPEAVAMTVAKACFAVGQHDAGEDVLKTLVQCNPDSDDLHGQVAEVMRAHGNAERAEELVAESKREIIQLNNDAVRRAKAGELAEAAEMLTVAARRLPGNLQIVTNASFALLYDVFSNGLDPVKLRTAQEFQHAAQLQNPEHPKLAEIAELSNRIREKYANRKA